MRYAMQVQGAMERLDVAFNKLHILIKRGEQEEALRFMKEGELKERFEELQSLIKLSSTNPLGASGVQNLRNI
tara:strand:- start:172 stop:390 length:219 start_codon:yes stop_codon:yes gene_type:complete